MSQGTRTTAKRAPARGVVTRPRRTHFLVLLLLAAATVVLYAPAGKLTFLSYDDPGYVTENFHVRTGLNGENVAWAFTSLDQANWHPLTWLSHQMDCQWFGLDPAGHHYTSVFFHTVNAVLLFLLLFKATGYLWRSFLVSALFAFHPINLQSVAWIAERKNLLSTFFLLIAIGCYGWYVKHPDWKRGLSVAGAFAASLMAKPMAVTFPFVLLLLDYWPLGRLPDPCGSNVGSPGESRPGWWRQLARLSLEKWPLAVLTVISIAITLLAQKRGGALLREDMPFRFSERLGNAMFSYIEYVRMMFWPSRLGIFYPYSAPSFRVAVLSALFVAGVTGLVLWLRRRKFLLFGWLFFLGTMVPVIGLVQVGKQAMADRYAYVPLIGLFIVVIWLAAEAVAALRVPRVLTIAVAGGVLLAAGVVTRINLPYWRNSVTVFSHAHDVASRADPMIEVNLGQALFSEGRLEESLQPYHLAEKIDPEDPVAHYDAGATLMQQSRLAQAAEEFQTALRCKKKNPQATVNALNNLGSIYLQSGNLAEAWKDYSATLEADPNHYPARMGRAVILYREAKYPEAADEIARAILIYPTSDAYLMLSRVLQVQGKSEQAAEAYQRGMLLAQ